MRAEDLSVNVDEMKPSVLHFPFIPRLMIPKAHGGVYFVYELASFVCVRMVPLVVSRTESYQKLSTLTIRIDAEAGEVGS